MSSSVYRPFSTPTEIRLLRLSSTDCGGMLCAALIYTDLLANPLLYDALSYTWGSSTDPQQTILLDQSTVKIRQNLFGALKQLQASSEHDLTLYVDALCINQNDLDEKANQVFMIGRIFRQAQRVIAWLGEHSTNSEMLFSDWPAEQREAAMIEEAQSATERNIIDRGGLTYQVESLRRDIWSAFLQRPFWSRMWIVQELVQAQSITVCCGNSRADWQNLLLSKHSYFKTPVKSFFSQFLRSIKLICGATPGAIELFDQIRVKTLDDNALDGLYRLEQIFEIRRMYQLSQSGFYPRGGPGNTMTLFHMVYEFKDRMCSVQLDRIYALMALEVTPIRLGRLVEPIFPNYGLQPTDVFLQVCKYRLKSIQFTSRKSFLIADMFEGLDLTIADGETVIDKLLDENDMFDWLQSYDRYVFTLIARALGELGLLNRSAVTINRSYQEIREFLVDRRRQRIVANRLPNILPLTTATSTIEVERVSSRSLRGFIVDLYYTVGADSRNSVKSVSGGYIHNTASRSPFSTSNRYTTISENT